MHLLNEVLRVLSGVLRQWKKFSLEHGEINCFSDLDMFLARSSESHAIRSLRSIMRTFDELIDVEHDLISLKDSLSEFSWGVSSGIFFPFLGTSDH